MGQNANQNPKKKRTRRRLRVWQRLFLAVAVLVLLGLCSTLFTDFRNPRTTEAVAEAEAMPADEESGWEEPVYAYTIADEGMVTVPFYNRGLAVVEQVGRGTYVELKSWEPFVAEDGTEYYEAYYNSQPGYFLCDNISDDKSDVLQESQVYVRTAVNLMEEPMGIQAGTLANKGDMLRVVGYDYLEPDGTVNMYEVKLGEEIGWVYSDYVVMDYLASLENWTNEDKVYEDHVSRGDQYGGGDAADLDYWPQEKGDFSESGNVMPESVYATYLSADTSNPATVEALIESLEGTAINTVVITVLDDHQAAFASTVLEDYGVLDGYECENTREAFAASMELLHEAGYYTVARISAFKDEVLAMAYPEWAITDLAGNPMQINSAYWPSVFSREVWELKVGLAVECVDEYGFNEIQFDYIRFPDYIINYERNGTADLKNTYNESKAQAVQRFLIYAKDIIHNHGAYVGADVFGETSNDYVAPYGQYWVAISTVVDVISGMPYPDHYSSYWNGTETYRPWEHPYATLYDWAVHVNIRQKETSSPAIVRTWIQTWDATTYKYDEDAMEREITALYDNGITGGYMPWYSLGTYRLRDLLRGVYEHDYYALYVEALEEGMLLSEYMGINTVE